MRAVALLVAASLCGCSYLTVTPVDDVTPCTESNLAPIVDTSLTALMALTLAVGASRCYQKSLGGNEQDGSPSEPCTVGPYVGLSITAVVGIATAISGIHGFRSTRRCRASGGA